MEIQHHFIREKVEDGSINVEYIPTSQQVADIFTKPLGRTRFETLRSAIGEISIDNLSREQEIFSVAKRHRLKALESMLGVRDGVDRKHS